MLESLKLLLIVTKRK